MPTNLYGPSDNYDLTSSHVIPALLRKAHEAKRAGHSEITIWRTGTPRREFLHVDDAASAFIHLMKVYSGMEHVNVETGEDLTIMDVAKLICDVVGFTGTIATDPSKPDGTPQKLLNISKLTATGWRPRYGLRDGLVDAYRWFAANEATSRLTAQSNE